MDNEQLSQHTDNTIMHQFQLDSFDKGTDRFMPAFTAHDKVFGAILNLRSGKLNFWRQSSKTEDKGSVQQCAIKLDYNIQYPFVVTNSCMPAQIKSVIHNMLTAESQAISLRGQFIKFVGTSRKAQVFLLTKDESP